MELPYKLYRLVRADGSQPERVDKHPFCMSRVYYDATEKPEEVWAELLDGCCRWRQTGSEVKVMVLAVPAAVGPGQLAVTIEPYFIKGGCWRDSHRWAGPCMCLSRCTSCHAQHAPPPSRPRTQALLPPLVRAVSNKANGEVYLEGELERGVVPEDCFWTHCQGEGEDGCMLYLRKMNLELLQK